MRWKYMLLMAAILLVALPFTAAANGAVIDEALDFTLDSADPLYPGASGEGWAWDAEAKVLTLSGIAVDVGLENEDFAVKLPDGAEIVLTAGSDNSIANSYGMGILCCDGSLRITGSGNLSIEANAHGIRAYNSLTIDMTGKMEITVAEDSYYPDPTMGLRVGNVVKDEYGNKISHEGNLIIRNCQILSIEVEDNQGIRVDGDVSISDCGSVMISAPGFNGIRNFGAVSISGCSQVLIEGYYNGIRSAGDVLITGCPDIEIRSLYEWEGEGLVYPYLNGIYTDSGSVTITDSNLTVYGAAFGIATGPTCDENGTGGDIIIRRSTVSASCDAQGFAAIFAGDDVYYSGEGEHAKILLDGSTIDAPAGGRIVDVNIDFDDYGMSCQSITSLAGITEITEVGQAAKSTVIKPTADEPAGKFIVSFNSQGGSAISSIALSGNGTITAPPVPTRSGYTFGGWYKDAECKNAWNFDTDTVTGDITLYAKWIPAATPGQLPPTSGDRTVPVIAILLGGALLLVATALRKVYA